MKRKRGAPSGNHNAYKHGFYSAAFKEAEKHLLSEMPVHDLSAEIELIRVTSLRLLRSLGASEKDLDLATQLSALRVLNLSAHSITTLLRTQVLAADARQAAADLDYLLSLSDQDQPPAQSPEPSSGQVSPEA